MVQKILQTLPNTWQVKVTTIQEAKNISEITLKECIRNLQTNELPKNSLTKEENKKHKSITLKALESSVDHSNLDEEIVAMIITKFKQIFKKNIKEKGSSYVKP